MVSPTTIIIEGSGDVTTSSAESTKTKTETETIDTIDKAQFDEDGQRLLRCSDEESEAAKAASASLKEKTKKTYTKDETTPFHTRVKMEHKNEPLASGLLIDFAQYDEFDQDGRQQGLLKALRELNIKERPVMIIDLATKRDLTLVLDGKDWIETEEEKKVSQPPCMRIAIPVDQIVDLNGVKPKMGSSIMRCNGCIPIPQWFLAANLKLQHECKNGRLIPFPLEQESGDVTYQAMRVNPAEFLEYQKLLSYTVNKDGPKKGFFIAAKFAYEVLTRKGYKEITYKEVGRHITDIIIRGDSCMKGVLIENSVLEDYEDIERNFLYI